MFANEIVSTVTPTPIAVVVSGSRSSKPIAFDPIGTAVSYLFLVVSFILDNFAS